MKTESPNLIKHVVHLFEGARNSDMAVPMEKYMKNLFPFLGIKTPKRRDLTQHFFKESGLLSQPLHTEFIRGLWRLDQREYQYLAVDYLTRVTKKLEKEHVHLLKELIVNKSWWDTVDTIAQKSVGALAERYPELINECIKPWSVHENIWLRRTAILFQLKYKENTNEELLFSIIEENSACKEFFIQKAIGWALREYSKTNPKSVRLFIENHQLANLSVREGSKYLI